MQPSDVAKPNQRNFILSPLCEKVWSTSKVENRQICLLFRFVEAVRGDLQIMLHTWGFRHCGWTAYAQWTASKCGWSFTQFMASKPDK